MIFFDLTLLNLLRLKNRYLEQQYEQKKEHVGNDPLAGIQEHMPPAAQDKGRLFKNRAILLFFPWEEKEVKKDI
jgi:hypothetical protein